MKSEVYNRISRRERNLVMTNLALLASVGVLLFVSRGYLEKFFSQKNNIEQEFVYFEDELAEKDIGGHVLLLGSLSIIGIAGWNIKRALPGLLNPEQSRIVKKWEEKFDLAQIASEIESELKDSYDIKFRDHKISLTKSWLIYQTLYDLELIEYKNIVWIYQSTTNHKIESTSVGQSHAILIYSHTGNCQLIDLPSECIEELFILIKNKNPKVLIGYQEELFGLWHGNRKLFFETINKSDK